MCMAPFWDLNFDFEVIVDPQDVFKQGPVFFLQLFPAVTSSITTRQYPSHRRALGSEYADVCYHHHQDRLRYRIIFLDQLEQLSTSCSHSAITHPSIITLLVPRSPLLSNPSQPLVCSPVLCLSCLLSDVAMRSDHIRTSDVVFLFLSA